MLLTEERGSGSGPPQARCEGRKLQRQRKQECDRDHEDETCSLLFDHKIADGMEGSEREDGVIEALELFPGTRA